MIALAAAAVLASAPFVLDPHLLWETWTRSRFVTVPAPCLRHEDLQRDVERLRARHGGRIAVETAGESVEGRPIQLLTVGTGRRHVLLWSQMHGDEPSATPALLDMADVLLSGSGPPGTREILDGVTLLLIPMLNPDGAERYERRNAQGIDINRDALNLATPEGRLLKALRDRFDPELGVNLHDQNRRTTVGDSGVFASISLLAVAGDAAGSGSVPPSQRRSARSSPAG
jgi:murein tripeptide amidase MpaA